MASHTTSAKFETMADLLDQLGGIAPGRVRLTPLPGRATERDLVRLNTQSARLYELVEGVLVEKVMGYPESLLACDLIRLLGNFLHQTKLGFLAGPDGSLRLMPHLVRLPVVSFVRKDRLPGGRRPTAPVPDLAPDLAVEILSEGNTPREMGRKLREYFLAGTTLVWLVDPATRTVTVYTAPDRTTRLTEADTLDGGDVLPGLTLPVREVFAEVPLPSGKGKRKTRRLP
jgi:Uma2 family endonuclease